jgi:predicted nucleotide-binding protein
VARKQPPEPELSKLVMPRPEFEGALDGLIEKGQAILETTIRNPSDLAAAEAEFQSWHDYIRTLLEQSFSSRAEADRYAYVPIRMGMPRSLEQKIEILRDDARELIRRLKSLKAQLDLYEKRRPEEKAARRPDTRDGSIFVVHGHAGEARETVARFLERVATRPVILDEEANRGQTVIEKFERFGSVAAFAVVLLTGDDEGRKRGDGEPQRRARQNVVFEFGYFIGKLGRDRTAILYEPSVELPSDLRGYVYVELDAGEAWKSRLARELKEAGISVDMNKDI